MFQLLVAIASHCPIIGAEVRDLVRMTARLQEMGAPDYVMPEGDFNFLDLLAGR